MKKVLLFNPPSALRVYSKSKIKAVVPKLPSMPLAMIAGSLQEDGAKVEIADLMLYDIQKAGALARQEIIRFRPDIVGVTATTPLFYEAGQISDIAKSVSGDIVTILGGPHASSLPADCLKESSFDIVVAGEGEKVIKEIVNGSGVKGVKGNEKSHDAPKYDLPMPALNLFDAKNYVCSRVIARNNPVGPIEMSTGCVFNCSFCNKTVHARSFRIKSPARIIKELVVLKELG